MDGWMNADDLPVTTEVTCSGFFVTGKEKWLVKIFIQCSAKKKKKQKTLPGILPLTLVSVFFPNM
jgi:hypothetical protein